MSLLDRESMQGREQTAARSSLRPDVEGLRAVAVVAVLVYHAGLVWVPGGFAGVDVFFVLSGFLITGLLVREVERDGRVRLGRFWARRARRLLPASTIVLVVSAVITVVVLPVTSRRVFGVDIASAAGYVVNWRLAWREVEYLAEDIGASPVQHFWSLAVEEQFYVVWPLLIVGLLALLRRRGARGPAPRVVLLWGAATITVASFAWTMRETVENPGLTFFVSTTRAWELGVGAVLALALPRLVRRVPAAARVVLGWLGLVAIAVAVVGYDESWAWPGVPTLLPVLGTAAVILAGGTTGHTRGGPSVLLGLRPAQAVGALSYSLYLWHWPLLIAAQAQLGADFRVRHGLAVVAVSVIPAYLSYRFVEDPLRHSPRLAPTTRALGMGAGVTGLSAAAGLAVVLSLQLVPSIPVADAASAPGAPAALRADAAKWATTRTIDAIRPAPLAVDLPLVYDTRECLPDAADERLVACDFAERDAGRTVALVGDSKALQWFTPLERIAEDAGWRLLLIGRDGCQFSAAARSLQGRIDATCLRWRTWALDRLIDEDVDVVVTTTRFNDAFEGPGATGPITTEAMVDGLASHWRRLQRAGAQVVPILDTPGRPGGGVPECIQENLERLDRCSYPLAPSYEASGAPSQLAAAREVAGVRPIDMNDVVCPDGRTCPAVIGNVRVYRSGSHLSDTYATTAGPILAERLAAATDGLLDAR